MRERDFYLINLFNLLTHTHTCDKLSSMNSFLFILLSSIFVKKKIPRLFWLRISPPKFYHLEFAVYVVRRERKIFQNQRRAVGRMNSIVASTLLSCFLFLFLIIEFLISRPSSVILIHSSCTEGAKSAPCREYNSRLHPRWSAADRAKLWFIR